MLSLRLVFHLALRQAEAFAGSILRLLGLDLSVPDHSTLSGRGRALAGRCPRVLPRPGRIHLVLDSTGLEPQSATGSTTSRSAAGASEMSPAEFKAFLRQTCSLLAEHSRDGSLHMICMDWRHLPELLEAAGPVYTELKNLCVWAKDNAGMGSLYRSQHELVLVYKHGSASHRNNVELGRHGRNRTNVWSYPGVNSFGRKGEEGNLLALHPTVKPVKLVADATLDCSARGEVVLDAFLGSGTTLMAAERVGRRCFGLELDPLYVDTAIRRWQALTGEAARHAASGRSFDALASSGCGGGGVP